MTYLSGLILCAGFSSRMGAFKPLVTYHGLPFLLHILYKMEPVCRELRVVTGFRSDELKSQIRQQLLILAQNNAEDGRWRQIRKKLQFIHNPQYPFGMFTSLKAGIRDLLEDAAVLYHMVDQPHIPEAFYPEISGKYRSGMDWLQPVFNGQPGHPLILGERVLTTIREAPPNTNLRKIKQENQFHIEYFVTGYREILSDFDYPADLREEAANEDI